MSATCRLIRPMQPLLHKPPIPIQPLTQYLQTRHLSSFSPTSFTSPTNPQTLTAHRTLPYTPLQIFEVISDIPSYPQFIPYLTSAHVSQYSTPDSTLNKRWPQLATLKIGYNSGPVDVNEAFTSRVFCAPPAADNKGSVVGYVEALSGSAVTSALDESYIAHHLKAASGAAEEKEGDVPAATSSYSPLEFLRTIWTIRPVPGDKAGDSPQTDVSLSIDYRFRSMMFEMLGATVAPRLAGGVVDLFEARMKKVCG